MLFPHTWCKLYHDLWKNTSELRGIILRVHGNSCRVWWVREGAQWCAERHCRGIWHWAAQQGACFHGSDVALSGCLYQPENVVQVLTCAEPEPWTHSPCAPGNNPLSHEKEIAEWVLGIFSFTVLIQTPFAAFLLISSWLWSGYRGKRDLIVKAAGDDLV